MQTTASAMGAGEAVRLGQIVRWEGQLATVFQLWPLGLWATIKVIATGRREKVRITELHVGALS